MAKPKPRRVREIAPPEPRSRLLYEATLYIESSALLRVLVEKDAPLEATLSGFERLFTSELTLIEVQRAIARARREGRQSAADHARALLAFREFVAVCTIGELTPAVRKRAALDFPVEPVRALDAIHLATFLAWADVSGQPIMASCDKRVRDNARALGFEVVP